jgi:hypothetical protein
MVFYNLLRRVLCCRTDIKATHELPSRPKQSSPAPSISNHAHPHHAEQPGHPRDSTDCTREEDATSSMPPKRKNADSADGMDRPEKKTKATKKAAKADPEAKEGKSNIFLLSSMITSATGLGGDAYQAPHQGKAEGVEAYMNARVSTFLV